MKKKSDLVGPAETIEGSVTALRPATTSARLRAKVFFVCALLDRSFNPGDEVVGWDAERIERYIGDLVEYRD